MPGLISQPAPFDDAAPCNDSARPLNNKIAFHRAKYFAIRSITPRSFEVSLLNRLLQTAGTRKPATSSVYQDYHPRDGSPSYQERDYLVTSDDAEKLRSQALERIRAASQTGELMAQRELAYLLYRWRELTNDNGTEVQHWTNEQLASDETVVMFAEAFTSYSWSQSMGFSGLGDTVARRNTRANVSTLQSIMDKDRFRSRVEELATKQNLSKDHADVIHEFLAAWKRHDANPNDKNSPT